MKYNKINIIAFFNINKIKITVLCLQIKEIIKKIMLLYVKTR